MARDESVIGTVGVLIVATRGPAGPGEVLIRIRGGSENYLAWSAAPLPEGDHRPRHRLPGPAYGRRHGMGRSARRRPRYPRVQLKSLAQESEIMFGYRVPAPDEAMLISGGRAG